MYLLLKNSLTPLYAQLEEIIREQILSGHYKEGDAIPSDTQLTKMYSITRTTVRKALSNLINEGYLYQLHGKGTFVRLKEVNYSIWNFDGFTDYLRSKNEVPVSRVLTSKVIEKDGEKLFYLKRYRGINKNGQILYLTIDTSYIPIANFPGIESYDFSDVSLYETMRNSYNTFPKQFHLSIIPIKCDEEKFNVFQLEDRNQPLLKTEGQVLDQDNNIIEYVEVEYGPNIDFKFITNAN